MALWKRRPVVDPEYAEFAFECFGWFLRHTRSFPGRRLVQPTDRFFPQRGLQGHELVAAVFEVVKREAGLERWSCRLEAQEADPNPRVSELVVVKGVESAAGTFRRPEGGPVITYNPTLVGQPVALVATLAHELAHLLSHTFPELPPGGAEAYEHATDVGTVFLGSGLFAANSRFEFSQYSGTFSQGWQWQRRGYLTEPQLLYALAIFCALREVPETEVLPHLKSHMRGSYKTAAREVIARGAQLDALRAIKPKVRVRADPEAAG
jgi:hypothetical protein